MGLMGLVVSSPGTPRARRPAPANHHGFTYAVVNGQGEGKQRVHEPQDCVGRVCLVCVLNAFRFIF